MKFQSARFNPSTDALATLTKCANGIAVENANLSPWHESYIRESKTRLAIDLDITKDHVEVGSKIMECGCIPLALTAALSASNYDVTGVDIDPERYKEAISRAGLKVVRCNVELETLPFDDKTFDAAIFNEMFEHLRMNPIFTLSEVKRVLKPGGILMLSTPNLRSLNGIYNFLIRNRSYSCLGNIFKEYKKLQELGHMGHVREFTTVEVTEFLQNIGFIVDSVIYRGRFGTNIKQFLARTVPSLRPFVSYIARKPIENAAPFRD